MLKDMLVVLFMSYPIFFSIEVLASFVPEAEVGMVAGIRGSCPDGSRLVSSDDVGHPLFDGGKS